jgi:hypothetical protein
MLTVVPPRAMAMVAECDPADAYEDGYFEDIGAEEEDCAAGEYEELEDAPIPAYYHGIVVENLAASKRENGLATHLHLVPPKPPAAYPTIEPPVEESLREESAAPLLPEPSDRALDREESAAAHAEQPTPIELSHAEPTPSHEESTADHPEPIAPIKLSHPEPEPYHEESAADHPEPTAPIELSQADPTPYHEESAADHSEPIAPIELSHAEPEPYHEETTAAHPEPTAPIELSHPEPAPYHAESTANHPEQPAPIELSHPQPARYREESTAAHPEPAAPIEPSHVEPTPDHEESTAAHPESPTPAELHQDEHALTVAGATFVDPFEFHHAEADAAPTAPIEPVRQESVPIPSLVHRGEAEVPPTPHAIGKLAAFSEDSQSSLAVAGPPVAEPANEERVPLFPGAKRGRQPYPPLTWTTGYNGGWKQLPLEPVEFPNSAGLAIPAVEPRPFTLADPAPEPPPLQAAAAAATGKAPKPVLAPWVRTLLVVVLVCLAIASIIQKTSSTTDAAAIKPVSHASAATPEPAPVKPTPLERAPEPAVVAAQPANPDNEADYPFARFVEVTGLRVVKQDDYSQVQYLVVNHSSSQLTDIGLKLSVRSAASAANSAPIFTLSARVPVLGPHQSKEIRTTLQLPWSQVPNWENLRTEVKVFSEQ